MLLFLLVATKARRREFTAALPIWIMRGSAAVCSMHELLGINGMIVRGSMSWSWTLMARRTATGGFGWKWNNDGRSKQLASWCLFSSFLLWLCPCCCDDVAASAWKILALSMILNSSVLFLHITVLGQRIREVRMIAYNRYHYPNNTRFVDVHTNRYYY